MRSIVEAFKHLLEDHDDARKMRRIAFRYSERYRMDGDVIQKTGEIIPKGSEHGFARRVK